MKSAIYPSLAAVITIFCTSAIQYKDKRSNIFFKYIGPTSTTTPSSAITTLTNWTLTANDPALDCSTGNIACGIEANSQNLQIILGTPSRYIPKKVYKSGTQAVIGGSIPSQIVSAASNQLTH